MPFIEIPGARLSYEDTPGERADAPLLLMVHGSCGGAGQWKRLSALLSPEFRTLRVDLFAEPFPANGRWTPDDDARAIAALIDRLDRPLHFIGHSGGCFFGWPAVQARRGRILSLTLFEPIFFWTLRAAGDPLAEWPRHMTGTVRALLRTGDLEQTMAFFVDYWAGREGAWAAAPEKVKAMMRAGGHRLLHEAEVVEREFDVTPPPAPILLVEGSETVPAMRAVCNHLAARWPGAAREMVRGAGHMAPFTHADAIAPAVRAHVLAAEGRLSIAG